MSRISLGEVIAVRRLRLVEHPTRSVVVRVGRPRRVRVGEWACPVGFTGLPETPQITGRGVDSCQALVDALQGVHYTLARSGLRLMWLGTQDETGFPRCVPYGLGADLAVRINRHIDRQLEQIARTGMRKKKVRRKGRRPKSRSNFRFQPPATRGARRGG